MAANSWATGGIFGMDKTSWVAAVEDFPFSVTPDVTVPHLCSGLSPLVDWLGASLLISFSSSLIRSIWPLMLFSWSALDRPSTLFADF